MWFIFNLHRRNICLSYWISTHYMWYYSGHAWIHYVKEKPFTWNGGSSYMAVNPHSCWSLAQSWLPPLRPLYTFAVGWLHFPPWFSCLDVLHSWLKHIFLLPCPILRNLDPMIPLLLQLNSFPVQLSASSTGPLWYLSAQLATFLSGFLLGMMITASLLGFLQINCSGQQLGLLARSTSML
jgi:hypothetical protein